MPVVLHHNCTKHRTKNGQTERTAQHGPIHNCCCCSTEPKRTTLLTHHHPHTPPHAEFCRGCKIAAQSQTPGMVLLPAVAAAGRCVATRPPGVYAVLTPTAPLPLSLLLPASLPPPPLLLLLLEPVPAAALGVLGAAAASASCCCCCCVRSAVLTAVTCAAASAPPVCAADSTQSSWKGFCSGLLLHLKQRSRLSNLHVQVQGVRAQCVGNDTATLKPKQQVRQIHRGRGMQAK
jgi:hypothetical protein